MNENPWIQAFWTVCLLVIIATGVAAGRSRIARVVGRVAAGLLMLVGGAAFNAVNLLTGGTYAAFADSALFGWVTAAWRAVVAPNQLLFIGLLVVFEAAAGVLLLLGGRPARFGYTAVIGFHLALWLFGWFLTAYVALIVPALILLLRAERRASSVDKAGAGAHRDRRVVVRH